MSRIITSQDIALEQCSDTFQEDAIKALHDAFELLSWAEDALWQEEGEQIEFLEDLMSKCFKDHEVARLMILKGLVEYETSWVSDLIKRVNEAKQEVYEAICLARVRQVSVETICLIAHEHYVHVPWQWI